MAAHYYNGTSTILNATISERVITAAALSIPSSGCAYDFQHTVAFNVSAPIPNIAAVYFGGPPANSSLTLQSSIVANNSAGSGNDVQNDLYGPVTDRDCRVLTISSSNRISLCRRQASSP